MTNIIYKEVQHLNKFWISILAIFMVIVFIYFTIQQSSISTVLIVLEAIFVIGILVLILSIKLNLQVRDDGIYLQFYPFHFSFRKIPLENLNRYYKCNYHPIRRYGGWGIRYSSEGKAYTITGNQGVQLELTSGKRILIGSQKPDEFVKAIELARQK